MKTQSANFALLSPKDYTSYRISDNELAPNATLPSAQKDKFYTTIFLLGFCSSKSSMPPENVIDEVQVVFFKLLKQSFY